MSVDLGYEIRKYKFILIFILHISSLIMLILFFSSLSSDLSYKNSR